MEEARREILERVASGELSPEEGAARLDELAGRTAGVSSAEMDAVRRVRIRSDMGSVVVEGDPAVREAVVSDGSHSARRDGDTLIIENSGQESGDFRFSFGGLRIATSDGRRLLVRVNPELPIEVETGAGSTRIRGMRGPIRADVHAGGVAIEGFSGPLDVAAHAGSVRANGRLISGTSRVRCEMGSVRLHLEQGSSVKIAARTSLGSFRVDGATAEGGGWRIGQGEAALDIETTMGSVRVTAEE